MGLVVNPGDKSSHNLPHDWRTAWDQFRVLRALGNKIGESTSGWQLEAPKGLFDRRWRLHYSFKGTLLNAYIGMNGKQAAEGIKELIKAFRMVHEGQLAGSKQPKPKEIKKPNPVFNPIVVARMKETWDEAIVKVKDNKSAKEFEQSFVYKFMHRRAGILPMTMQQYLYQHPHGVHWITPPKSEEQLRNRQRELENRLREKERQRYYE